MNLSLFVTGKCQFLCDYCYVNKLLDQQDMPLDTALLAIDKFGRYAATKKQRLHILLTGGEPLIVWANVHRILEYASKIVPAPRIFLTTNGLALSREIIETLKTYNTIVSFSLDGLKRYHIKHRKAKFRDFSYNTLINNAKYLLDYICHSEARMTVSPDTVHKLHNNIMFLKSLGFKQIRFGLDYFSQDWHSYRLNAYREQLKILTNDYNTLINEGVSCPNLDGKLESLKSKKVRTACSFESYNVMPDSMVYPCSHFRNTPDFAIGNIKNTNINMRKLPDHMKQILGKMPHKCKDCEINKYCLGAKCLGANYIYTNHFLKPLETICALERITYEVLQDYQKN